LDLGSIGNLISQIGKLSFWRVLAIAGAAFVVFLFASAAPLGTIDALVRVIALFVTVLASLFAIIGAVEHLYARRQAALTERRRLRRLHDLTLTEQMLLLPIMANQNRTGHIQLHEQETAIVLARERIVHFLQSAGLRDDWLTVQVEEWAWQYLRSHPDLYNPLTAPKYEVPGSPPPAATPPASSVP
jgi:hypothetical protein